MTYNQKWRCAMFERTYSIKRALIITCISMVFSVLNGCRLEQESCVTCHMDKDKLKEVADAIETAEDTGEG